MQYSGLINSKPVVQYSYFVPQHYCTICKSLQKQLFRIIHKVFPYVLYNIKYLLVISHSGGYPLSLIVTYSMISSYYALVLGNRPFPNLLFHFFFVISLLRIFDLESHSQTSVKVGLVMFGLICMKFKKLRSLCRENKKLDPHQTQIVLLFKPFPILWASSIGQKLFSKN